jgi:hypothetical protein
MIDGFHRKLTSAFLLFFGVWDAILAAGALAAPGLWFRFFHDAPVVDPQALLARTGAIWAAFAIFHLIAWRVWQRKPYWLAIVGGMRLGEIFADVTYLLLAESTTGAGRIALLVAAPSNVVFSIYFIRTFIRATRPAAVAPVGATPMAPQGGGT